MKSLRCIPGCLTVMLFAMLTGCDSSSDNSAGPGSRYLSNLYIGDLGTKYYYSIQTKTGDATATEAHVAEVGLLAPAARNYPYELTKSLPSGGKEIFALQPDGPSFVGVDGTSPGGPYQVRYTPPIMLLEESVQAPATFSCAGQVQWTLPDGQTRQGTYEYTVDLLGYEDVFSADRDYPDCLVVEVDWKESYDDYEIDRREAHVLAPGVGPVRSHIELDGSYPYDAVIQQTLHTWEIAN